MKNLAHSASFDSADKDAPLKPGIKHLARFSISIVTIQGMTFSE